MSEITLQKNGIKKIILFAFLVFAPAACIFISLITGRYPIPVSQIFSIFLNGITGTADAAQSVTSNILWQIRLPRALLGCMVGASLAVSGTALQGLFRNPLVSSGMLGVSAGAGFGAALAIVLFGNTPAIYVFSFFFGTVAVLLSYLIGRIYNTAPVIMLVLGGVIISSIFSALLSLMKYIADPYEDLPSIVFWLMGSLASASYKNIMVSSVPVALGMAGLMAMRWRINVMSMGDREARSMGLNVNFDRAVIIICTTLVTAGAVSISGVIGWVGLVIPHIGRMIAGNDNRILIPASISLGACFLTIIDTIGRMITGTEIPLSILTALVGGPFFVYLLKKTKGGNW